MNIHDIRLLYNYNYWANGQILATAKKVTVEQFLASAEFPYGGLRGTMTHIIEAEWGWRVRCQGLGYAEELLETEFPTLASLETRWKEEEKSMRAFLARLRDENMESMVRYKTYPPPGEIRERVLWHCLFSVVNHGTQHRSEAAALLTRYGQSPGDLDFNFFMDQSKS